MFTKIKKVKLSDCDLETLHRAIHEVMDGIKHYREGTGLTNYGDNKLKELSALHDKIVHYRFYK